MLRSVAAIETIVTNFINYLNDDVYLGDTTGVCFDCDLWNNGYTDPANPSIILIPPLKTTIDTIMGETIAYLEDLASTVTDYGFASQIERLIIVTKDIRSKINAIQCSGSCPDPNLLAQLLTTLVVTVTELVTAMELLNGLVTYYGTCGCLGSRFFEITMGKFINQVTDLQCILQDWSILVMSFFQFASMPAKSYVASYVPNQPIPSPSPQSMTGYACVPCPPSACDPNYQYGCGGAPNCIPYSPYC